MTTSPDTIGAVERLRKLVAEPWRLCDMGFEDRAELVADLQIALSELSSLREVVGVALGALEDARALVPAVMMALMATKGRDDLLLADKVHRHDAAMREAVSRLKGVESGG